MSHDPSLKDAEKVLPEIAPGNFPPRDEAPPAKKQDMLTLKDWRLIGWTFAVNVGDASNHPSNPGVKFACLFESLAADDAKKKWCIVSAVEFRALAGKKLQQNKAAKK